METLQAKWQTLPEDGEKIWRTVLRETPLAHWLMLFAVTALLVALRLERAQRRDLASDALLFGWIGIGAYLAYTFSSAARLLRPTKRLVKRLESEDSNAVGIALVTIHREDMPIGQDEGFVENREGMLVFRGNRTSFKLKRADAFIPPRPLTEESDEHDWQFGSLADGSAKGFLLAEHPEFRVFFFSLRSRGFLSVERLLTQWLSESSEAKGQTVLPPLTPLPGYRWPGESLKRKGFLA